MQNLQPFIDSLQKFAQKRLGFKYPPKLFLKQDQENAKSVFGKTAYYDPNEKSITLFTTGRHPKDILRSFAHELVHHCQNLRGDLTPEKCGPMGTDYAQKNDHMREMETEAFKRGNLCFRDWEDGIKVAMQKENNQLKENNKMVKISKKELKGLIEKILENKLEEMPKKATNFLKQVKKVSDDVIDSTKGSGEDKEETAKLPKDAQDFIKKAKSAADDVKKTATGKTKSPVRPVREELEETEDLEEGHCNSARRNDKKKMEENEELEEGEVKNPGKYKTGMKAGYDDDGDGVPNGADKNPKDGSMKESKIQTPEQEQKLYESRFNKRNEEIFDKLKKLWTK